jgi:hypothetical protein
MQPVFYYYRVERTDGYRITLNFHFRGVRNLGRMIMQQVDAARLSEELKRGGQSG